MISTQPIALAIDPTWRRYRDNFPRHVLGVSRYLESQIMERLTGAYGFKDLRLYYEPYISLLPREGARLTDLAEALNISRQAANQTANLIENAGYIRRIPDATDGRAKRIKLTAHGLDLRRCGLEVAARLQHECEKIVGEKALRQSVETLKAVCLATNTYPPEAPGSKHPVLLVGLLPRISNFINHRLMALGVQRGHDGLKLSYGQVLALIGPEGGRILQIASLQNVSKQAVSSIVNELEELGYIYREPDPNDARQVLLRFTGLGRTLIEDSVENIDELEFEMSQIVGVPALDQLRSTIKRLYHALQPEVAVFTNNEPDLAQLARELRQKLSPEARQHLANLLLK
ncbi:MarR family transcriptional regulator [Parahaliea sp. F7430]|uniref:MarR family transcriptional regulator n=1 Tax=Sediminihaliea albiluteola TaxID=2758564 RepID=A0A7W2TXC2_9GAMM|nr:MarR family transcriptional regulator [Sediminihaliea albiluteola]MBA6413686.1 MarR family transcriptional regulator [Sediminihaliea albiluteola]